MSTGPAEATCCVRPCVGPDDWVRYGSTMWCWADDAEAGAAWWEPCGAWMDADLGHILATSVLAMLPPPTAPPHDELRLDVRRRFCPFDIW
jgi:hypothetical protein